MFLHIATNIKELNEVIKIFEEKTGCNTSEYAKITYNLTNIDSHTAKEMINNVLVGRINKKLCIIVYDHIEQLEYFDAFGDVLKNNCIFITE